MANIVKEIGDAKFTEKQIEGIYKSLNLQNYYIHVHVGAVKSHMKYLRDNRHTQSVAVQNRVRIRSRQQRVGVLFICVYMLISLQLCFLDL